MTKPTNDGNQFDGVTGEWLDPIEGRNYNVKPTTGDHAMKTTILCERTATIANVTMRCENHADHPGDCWYNVLLAASPAPATEGPRAEGIRAILRDAQVTVHALATVLQMHYGDGVNAAHAERVEQQLAALTSEVARLTEENRSLIGAGQLLSNVAFNLAQSAKKVPDANDRGSLDSTYKAWDALREKHIAAVPPAEGPRAAWTMAERRAHHARVNPDGEDREGYRPDEDESPAEGLRTATDALVSEFADALRAKLREAEARHGWNGLWQTVAPDTIRADMHRHIVKGDPLDVAAYCAFLWKRGESTAPAAPACPLCPHCGEPLTDVYLGVHPTAPTPNREPSFRSCYHCGWHSEYPRMHASPAPPRVPSLPDGDFSMTATSEMLAALKTAAREIHDRPENEMQGVMRMVCICGHPHIGASLPLCALLRLLTRGAQ